MFPESSPLKAGKAFIFTFFVKKIGYEKNVPRIKF
jgi:hypothetical protein